MFRALAVLGFVITPLAAGAADSPRADDASRDVRLYFPQLVLRPNEQIQAVTVKVACAHVQSLAAIPSDWNIELMRPVSAVETFHASAGRGISYWPTLQPLDGVLLIRVVKNDEGCFRVSASVTVVADRERKIPVSSSQLRLVAPRLTISTESPASASDF